MIVRIWHGETGVDKTESYFDYLQRTGVGDYQTTAGNRGVMVLRRVLSDRTEWLTISLWDSLEAIRGFAGDDIDRAVYYPADADYLLSFEPEVRHYELLLQAGGPAEPDRSSRSVGE